MQKFHNKKNETSKMSEQLLGISNKEMPIGI